MDISRIKIFFLILIVGAAAYSNSFHNTFQFDDEGFIVNNIAVRDVGNIKRVWQAMETPTRFVTFYTFALNYHLHGLNVVGFHVVNLLIHLLTACLVYLLGVHLFSTPALKDDTLVSEREKIAIFSALVFVAHPVQTQAVTYIAQRFASLATLFYVASVLFYLVGRLRQRNDEKFIGFFIGALICAVFGIFSKEIVITLPLIIVMMEWLLFPGDQKRSKKASSIMLGALCLLALLIPAIYSFRIKSMLFSPMISESHDGDVITLIPYLLTQSIVALTFLRLLIAPVYQNLDYDFALSQSLFEPVVLFSLVIIIGMVAVAYRIRKSSPLVAFGIFWFFIAFSSNLVPRHNVMFEHKVYLLSIGFCLCFCYGVFSFLKNKKAAADLLSLIIILLMFLTFSRNRIWSNDLILWSDVVKKSPYKSRPHLNLGNAYSARGKYKQALDHINKAIDLNPKAFEPYNSRGLINYHLKQYEKALADYNRAMDLNPRSDYHKALVNRGVLYTKLKEYDLAFKDYNRVLKGLPDYAAAYISRGNLKSKLRRFDEAIKDYDKAIEHQFKSPEVYINRGNAYKFLGEMDLAIKDLDQAIALNPELGMSYFFRSEAYFAQGRYAAAFNDMSDAISFGYTVPRAYVSKVMKAVKRK